MNITELSLRRPVTTLMIFISLLVIGLISLRMVPLELIPDISFPGASIQIPYPNSTPTDINENITRPIEGILATISGVEQINSNSGENNAVIVINFKQGSDINLKAIEIKEKIESISNQLPDDLEHYDINKFQAGAGITLQLRVSGNRDLSDSFDLLDRNLKQRLDRIPGVGQVVMYGVEKKEIHIELKPDRLARYNLDLNQLAAVLRQSNFSTSAGKITDAGLRYTVRPVELLQTIEDIENLIIREPNLRVKDVAEVTYKTPINRDVARHLDQKRAIGLDITKETNANTVEVVNAIMAELEKIDELPEMQGIQIYKMFDEADGILSSLKELFNAGLIGALLSIFVLYFFLRQFSITLIVAMAVPFSLIVTLGFFFFLDISLNLLSMMGLMVAIGMLVDNAVVVTENIHRYQRLGENSVNSSILGAKQVGVAVTAGTLTSIIVFLPNVLVESFVSAYFFYIGMAVIIALLASLFISLSLIPLLVSKIKLSKISNKETFIDKLSSKYSALLGWFLARRTTSVISIAILFFTGLIPMSFMSVDMFPPVEERQLNLHYNLNSTYTLDTIKESVDRMEQYLYDNKENFEIDEVYSFYTPERALSTLNLTGDEQAGKSTQQIKKEIEKNLPQIAIGKPSFEVISRTGSDQVQVFVHGESMELLEELAEEVAWQLGQVEGFADVSSEAEMGSNEIQLTVNRDRADNFGLTSSAVANLVSGSVRGETIQRIRGKTGEIDVVLSLQEEHRQTIDDLKNLPISNGVQTIKLASIADFEQRMGAGRIFRNNRSTSLGITINLDDLLPSEAQSRIATVMDRISYPTGYSWSYGRSFDDDTEALFVLIFNIIIAFFLIYLVMASLFESLLHPASVMSCIIFGIVGIFWFFLITGTHFDFMAIIGILILMGIVVNNGIVLIDHIIHLRKEGLSRRDAVIKGGKDRLRPIIMTAVTTILALVPLALGNARMGGIGPMYYPMARAIIGGLLFSTVVTLLVLPSIYVILDDIKIWTKRISKAAS